MFPGSVERTKKRNDHISAYTTPTHFIFGTEYIDSIFYRTKNQVRWRLCVDGDMVILFLVRSTDPAKIAMSPR